MDRDEIVKALAALPGRAAGSDAERRAARWLQERLRAEGREVELETHWVRPRRALVGTLHAALGVIGSILAVPVPVAGVAVLGVALISLVLDASGRGWLLRRLTPERATQNVVSPSSPRGAAEPRMRLIVAAHYDAGRGGVIYADPVQRAAARVRAAARGLLPGGAGATAGLIAIVLAMATLRLLGTPPTWVGIVQFVPSVILVVTVAARLDIALSDAAPGAGESASAAAVAVALVEALDEAPPRNLAVELVLAGAGTGPALGMARFVRERRRRVRAQDTVVLGVAPCGGGIPHWWRGDGPVLPLRFHPRLRELAAQVAGEEAHLHAREHRGHGTSVALPARRARWPAITVGCLESGGRVPRAGQAADTPDNVDPRAMDTALELALALVDALDVDLARRAPTASRPAPASTPA